MNKSDLEKMQKFNEEYEKQMKASPFQSEIDKIARDIIDRRNNIIAMEFTRTIGKLLRENGIVVHYTENTGTKESSDNSIEAAYGVVFDGVDCTEHDKKFVDKIKELEEENSELYENLDTRIRLMKNIKDENDCIKKQLEDYEQKYSTENDLIGLTPIEVAEKLISAEGEYKTSSIQRAFGAGEKGGYNVFSTSDLRQIAEHLLVYCNHNSEENS